MNIRAKFIQGKRLTLLGLFVLFLAATILFAFLPHSTGLEVLSSIGLSVTGVILGFRGLRALIRTSIWRLRNRLIVTYIFIGFVPLALILVLVGTGGYILAGQTAMYLVSSELDRTIGDLSVPARVLAMNPNAPPSLVLDQTVPFIRQHFSHFDVVVQRNGQVTHYPAGSTLEPASADMRDYSGLTIKDGTYCAWSHSKNRDLTVDVLAPIENEMLAGLVPHLGQVSLSGDRARVARRNGITPEELRTGDVNTLPPPSNQFDYEVNWLSAMGIAQWQTGKTLESSLLLIATRPSALLGAIFGERFKIAQGFLYVFIGLMVLFLLVELVSLVIGVSLTRSITGAMQNLYVGTRSVAEGDFSTRIAVKGKDQLAAVTESFNSMTERLERLVIVEKEKERLQSELEIAREVQNQLFPRSSPSMKTLEVVGLCRPARMVSGDYYDFLCLQDSNMAIAIGDVAGKGISAALLMASIQSIMRTQLSAVTPMLTAKDGVSRPVYSTSTMVSRLNEQLYQNTSPEKYATFLFGVYDEKDRLFTYTNAGHLPPLLIRKGEATFLEVTGTVVGAFPRSVYEEQKVLLEPGDILVSYTDGITEPENEYGEEFGADRLVETVLKHQKLESSELVIRVMDAVRAWTTAPELPDDMTLVLARRTG